MLFILILLSISLMISLFFLYKKIVKNKNLKEICSQQTDSINKNWEKIDKLSQEKATQHERIIELEDAINGGFNVSIRNEVTEVISEFTKLEMVIILSGISLLLKRTDNPERSATG